MSIEAAKIINTWATNARIQILHCQHPQRPWRTCRTRHWHRQCDLADRDLSQLREGSSPSTDGEKKSVVETTNKSLNFLEGITEESIPMPSPMPERVVVIRTLAFKQLEQLHLRNFATASLPHSCGLGHLQFTVVCQNEVFAQTNGRGIEILLLIQSKHHTLYSSTFCFFALSAMARSSSMRT